MTCGNLSCNNEVPKGWEGGYCTSCCAVIERIESYIENIDPVPLNELTDPYEEYGFDHPWEK